MKNKTIKGIFRRENLVAGGLLSLYGTVLFSLDPQWVMWAGSMTVGVLGVGEALPPPLGSGGEAAFLASVAGLAGLLAPMFLHGASRGPHL